MVRRQFRIVGAPGPADVRKAPDLNRLDRHIRLAGHGAVPLVIRTRADIQALSAFPQTLKRLPPEGPIVDVPELDESAREAFRLQIRRYIRACGCAAGGATFLVTSAACMACAGCLAFGQAWSSVAKTIGAGAILVPIFTVAAKLLGLRLARPRFSPRLRTSDPGDACRLYLPPVRRRISMTCRLWVDQGHIACESWTDEVSGSCVSWRDDGQNQCTNWADEGSNECSQWKDEGQNECSQWADEGHNECCDWWPCSWACDAFYWVANWVCQGWYWVANWVCQAWYWVAKWVCIAWYWVANWVCQVFAWVVKAVCLATTIRAFRPMRRPRAGWVRNAANETGGKIVSRSDRAFAGFRRYRF